MNTTKKCKCGKKILIQSKECRECWHKNLSQNRMGEKNNRYGKKLTKEHRLAISNANRGKGLGFKKGYAPWNKNKKGLMKWSESRREKMMKYFKTTGGGMKGKKHKLETRLKLSNDTKGEKSPTWKGGLTSINDKIRHSIESHLWRDKVFERDNYTCQCCKIRGRRLHPHHIYNFADFTDLRFAVYNGITLCRFCHIEFHRKYGKRNNNGIQLGEFISKYQRTQKSG